MMTLNNIPRTESKLKDLDIKPYQIKKFTSKFDLTINFTETEDELACSFTYSTQIIQKSKR